MSHLPAEARAWLTSADAYERGTLTLEALAAVRVDAWKFYDSRTKTASPEELSGLRVVMFRLWPEVDNCDYWSEEAFHFLDFCHSAGLGDQQLLVLLREHFAGVLDETDNV